MTKRSLSKIFNSESKKSSELYYKTLSLINNDKYEFEHKKGETYLEKSISHNPSLDFNLPTVSYLKRLCIESKIN